MSAIMGHPGPITSPGLGWAEQELRRVENQPRGWEGFKISAESGLTHLEIQSLRSHGYLA